MMTGASISNKIAGRKRQYLCSRCLNHGHVEAIKGHSMCPRKFCTCDKCEIVSYRQKVMAAHAALRRYQDKKFKIKLSKIKKDRTDVSPNLQQPVAPGTLEAFKGNLNRVSRTEDKNNDNHTPKSGTIHYKGAVSLSMNVEVKNPAAATEKKEQDSTKEKPEPRRNYAKLIEQNKTIDSIGLKISDAKSFPTNTPTYIPKTVIDAAQPRAPNAMNKYASLDDHFLRVYGIPLDEKNKYTQEMDIHYRSLYVLCTLFPDFPLTYLESMLALEKGNLLFAEERLLAIMGDRNVCAIYEDVPETCKIGEYQNPAQKKPRLSCDKLPYQPAVHEYHQPNNIKPGQNQPAYNSASNISWNAVVKNTFQSVSSKSQNVFVPNNTEHLVQKKQGNPFPKDPMTNFSKGMIVPERSGEYSGDLLNAMPDTNQGLSRSHTNQAFYFNNMTRNPMTEALRASCFPIPFQESKEYTNARMTATVFGVSHNTGPIQPPFQETIDEILPDLNSDLDKYL